ncbi:hypothetical protein [Psychromonas antarctica]|uniref:hypothetical protein n=1 Tax=Psychromonas antarctica TaxID=67573 RepID=UPI001EE7C11A|nr:hypothetical protein [Psychromonas antarctica]MCG6202956.1 hypothetical protein [Psychromonas antarctica]
MTRTINGVVRKIESESEVFFDFEFWGESDQDTYGLLCFIQMSSPTKLFITEMNANELAISNDAIALESVKNRISNEIGVKDLVFPKVIRFDKKMSDANAGFQAYLKTYEKPVPVYESIFDKTQEAKQVEKLSIDKFKQLGGQIKLIGQISVEE